MNSFQAGLLGVLLVALLTIGAGFLTTSQTNNLGVFALVLFVVATSASIAVARWVSRSFPDAQPEGGSPSEKAARPSGLARLTLAIAACCFLVAAILGVEKSSSTLRIEVVIGGLLLLVLTALLRSQRPNATPPERE